MKLALSLILSFVFLLWFVASVVGMVYVSRSAELSWLIPVILGQFFLVIGTAGLTVMLRAKKKDLWIDIVAILIGAIIVALPLIYHFGSEQTKTAITAHIPTLAGAGLLIAGLCGTLAAYIGQKRAAEKYSTPVEGICVERKTRLGSGGAVLHCPVYEITPAKRSEWKKRSIPIWVYLRSVKAERCISTKMTLTATSSRLPIRVQE